MTRARLSIALPAETWVHRVSGDHPETSITVLAAIPTDETGSALIRIEG